MRTPPAQTHSSATLQISIITRCSCHIACTHNKANFNGNPTAPTITRSGSINNSANLKNSLTTSPTFTPPPPSPSPLSFLVSSTPPPLPPLLPDRSKPSSTYDALNPPIMLFLLGLSCKGDKLLVV
ncbi:hypothetical protein HanRHA438_Chr07g0310151 [Helianthus annuus]|nr:hypothetical protein HanIR_Chr07g0323711 [Helianthus annuus]KAJ0908412.1 hypothetical protein HanRHA438_Chr07g0310151 [Helianthus annuus]